METVPCDLCGSERCSLAYSMPDRLFHPQELFHVVECADCGLGFVNPRPSRAEMARFYPKAFYADFTENGDHHERRYREEARYLEDLERTLPQRRLLDVGCAGGDFPRLMKSRGWEVEGVEPFAEAADPGFPVHRVGFPEFAVDAPTYDAVTAWAVFEHVHDPKAHFAKASRVLKPGGRLVFLVTNFSSLASRRLFAEDVPRHLYFFTEPAVRRYLEAAGLELVRADYDNRIYSLPPRHWLHRGLRRAFGGELSWPTPATYQEYLEGTGRTRSAASLLRYCLFSPVSVLDRVLLPLIERVQIWRRTYGIVTYVARKPA